MPKKKSTSSSLLPPQTLQLKISLDYSKPPIWRRVLIPNTYTLHQLHLVIQSAFWWYNCHMYGFNLPGKERVQAVDLQSGVWEKDWLQDYQVDSNKYLVTDILTEPKKRLHYEYDFGDGWTHTIELEKILDELIEKPKLIKANNYAPVEDCGGILGWNDEIKFLKNYPNKPSTDDKEHLEWLLELIPDLDEENPKSFDPSVVNFEELAEHVELFDADIRESDI